MYPDKRRLQVASVVNPSLRAAAAPNQLKLTGVTVATHTPQILSGANTNLYVSRPDINLPSNYYLPKGSQEGVSGVSPGEPRSSWVDYAAGPGAGVLNAVHGFANIVPQAIGQVKAITPHFLDPYIDTARNSAQNIVNAPFNAANQLQREAGFTDVNNRGNTQAYRTGETIGNVGTNVAALAGAVRQIPRAVQAIKNIPTTVRAFKQAVTTLPQGLKASKAAYQGVKDAEASTQELVGAEGLNALANENNPDSIRNVVSARYPTLSTADTKSVSDMIANESNPDNIKAILDGADEAQHLQAYGSPDQAYAATHKTPENRPAPAFTPEEQRVLDEAGIKQPAVERGTPQTVGEASYQAQRGIFKVPDEAFNADKKLIDSAQLEQEARDVLARPAFGVQANDLLKQQISNILGQGKLVGDQEYMDARKALSAAYDKDIKAAEDKGLLSDALSQQLDAEYNRRLQELDAAHERTTNLQQLTQMATPKQAEFTPEEQAALREAQGQAGAKNAPAAVAQEPQQVATQVNNAADEAVKQAYKQTVKDGGVTINLEGKQPKEGFAYAPNKDTEVAVPSAEFSQQHVQDFATQHLAELQKPGNHLGIWEDNGQIYMDISRVGAPSPATLKAAQDANQLAVFDLKNFEEVPTGQIDQNGVYSKLDEASNIFDNYKKQVSGAGEPGGVPGISEVPEGTPAVAGQSPAQEVGFTPEEKQVLQDHGINSPAANRPDAANRVIEALKGAQTARNKTEAAYSVERSKRVAAATGASQDVGGEAGFKAALGQLKGDLAGTETPGIRGQFDQAGVDSLFSHLQNHDELRPYERIRAQQGLAKLFEGGKPPTNSEIQLLSKAFGEDFGAAVKEATQGDISNWQKFRTGVAEVLNIPRALMSSFDVSAGFRQGLFLSARYPKQFFKAFASQFKYLGSSKAYNAVMDDIASRPTFAAMKAAKVPFTEMGNLEAREERFMSNFAERIPLVGRGVAASDRAYTGFLNKLRADVFDNIYNGAREAGVNVEDPKFLSSLGRFTGSASGRGNLGPLEGAAKELNTFFFSPRLMASRLNLLNPVYYAKLDPYVRRQALQSLLALSGAVGTVLTAARLGGASVGADPRSADFGKIKIGNTRVDVLGGFQQYVRLGAQLITGQSVSSTTGKTQQLGAGFGKSTRLDIVEHFLQGKENPVASFVTDALKGTDFANRPISWKNELTSRVTPLLAQDVADIYSDQRNKGASLGQAAKAAAGGAVIGAGGFGIQTYSAKGQPGNAPGNKADQPDKAFADYANNKSINSQAQKDFMANLAPKDKQYFQIDTTEGGKVDIGTKDLEQLYKDGKISKDQYEYGVSLHKVYDRLGAQGEANSLPKGLDKTAEGFYKKYGALTADGQDKWLKGKPDQLALDASKTINKQLPKGLSKLAPTNQLLQEYAKFQKDYAQNGKSWDQFQARTKIKDFWLNAAKTSRSQTVQDIYKSTVAQRKYFLDNGKISKKDLDAAVQLDNELLKAGLISSPKFSKKFRNAFGYGAAPSYTTSSGGSSSSGRGSSSGGTYATFTNANGTTRKVKINASGFAANSPIGLSHLVPSALSFSIPTIDTIPHNRSFQIDLPPDVTSQRSRPQRAVSTRQTRVLYSP